MAAYFLVLECGTQTHEGNAVSFSPRTNGVEYA